MEWAEEREQIELLCGGLKNIAQIQAVMRWTLQLQGGLWKEGLTYEWYLTGGPEGGRLIACSSNSGRIHKEPETGFPRVAATGRFLTDNYIGRLMAPLRRHYRCTRDYPFREEGEFAVCIWTYIQLEDPPTAHEQMEAALSLRHWVQDHATPEEFAEIWKHVEE